MPMKHYGLPLLDSALQQNNSENNNPTVLMFKHSKMTKIIQQEEIVTHLINFILKWTEGGATVVFIITIL